MYPTLRDVLGESCRSIFKVQEFTLGVFMSGCTPLGGAFAPGGSGAPGTMLLLPCSVMDERLQFVARRQAGEPLVFGYPEA
jgi:hypothetical protein